MIDAGLDTQRAVEAFGQRLEANGQAVLRMFLEAKHLSRELYGRYIQCEAAHLSQCCDQERYQHWRSRWRGPRLT
jgi:hypothetical protein